MTENISITVAFVAGLLSFLSPCVLPMAPVYLSNLYGPEINNAGLNKNRISIFLRSLSFVVGFSIIFITLGVIAGLTSFIINPNQALLNNIAGSLLIAFGVFLLVALKVPWLNYEKRLTPSLSQKTGYLRAFLTGAVFSMAWTACVGPILGGILTLAMNSASIWQGAYLLAIYSLGLGLPFLIIGAAFNAVAPIFKRIHRYSGLFHIISGFLLIAVGLLVLTNRLPWLLSITS